MGIQLTLVHKVIAILVVAVAVCLGGVAAVLTRFKDDRSLYQAIKPGAYHPSFFWEYELARRNKAGWITDARTVAEKYAGVTRLCPDGKVEQSPAGPDQAIFIFTNKCWAGLFSAKKYRVDLIQRGAAWEIEWSGVQYRCARNPNDPGSILLARNPLRQMRNPVAALANSAVRSFAYNINPWHTTCP